MTADTPDIARLAADMRARAEKARQDFAFVVSLPRDTLAILDALARAEQERDAARETIGRLCEALEPFADVSISVHAHLPDAIRVGGLEGFTLGELRRAACALASVREGGANDKKEPIE